MSSAFPSQDFDLQLVKAGDRYLANVLKSPAGDAQVEFALPFDSGELDALFRGLGQVRKAPTRGADSPEIRTAQEIGRRLFMAVFSGDVSNVFRESVGRLVASGQGLRLRLRLTNVPELLDLPWELLFDASRGRFLLLEPQNALVRYLPVAVPVQPIRVALPLKILVAVSSPQSGRFAALDVEQERSRLQQALRPLEAGGNVSVRTLTSVTQRSLRQELRNNPPHILHFIGHGTYDRAAGSGYLIFEDEQGDAALLSGSRLTQILQECPTLRLVVLNACEGGRTSVSDPFAGVAQALVQGALPAVVAMQFPITDSAAVTFAGALYDRVAQGDPMDLALAAARREINLEGDDGDIEWATPVLYLRGEGDLFDLAEAKPSQAAQLASLDGDVLAAIRKDMIVAKSVIELRHLRHRVEGYLSDHPSSSEGRELLEQLKRAIHAAERPPFPAALAQSPSAQHSRPPMTSGRLAMRARIGAAFAGVAAVGAILFFNLSGPGDSHLISAAPPPTAEPAQTLPKPSDTPPAAVTPKASPGQASQASRAASPTGADPFQECTECPSMKIIPAGIFTMGSPPSEVGRSPDEGPQRSVRVSGFAIGVTEVTFAEWDACVAAGGCDGYRPDDNGWRRGISPVIYVSWNDAKAYVRWLNTRTGTNSYRLPSEAEWEYAARAGSTTPYWWGALVGSGNANCDGCGSLWGGRRTAPVNSFQPNAFGLRDMAGNVLQWVEDCYLDSYQGAPGDGSAREQGARCANRALRGGSWYFLPSVVRSAARLKFNPDWRDDYLGFRVARTLP